MIGGRIGGALRPRDTYRLFRDRHALASWLPFARRAPLPTTSSSRCARACTCGAPRPRAHRRRRALPRAARRERRRAGGDLPALRRLRAREVPHQRQSRVPRDADARLVSTDELQLHRLRRLRGGVPGQQAKDGGQTLRVVEAPTADRTGFVQSPSSRGWAHSTVTRASATSSRRWPPAGATPPAGEAVLARQTPSAAAPAATR